MNDYKEKIALIEVVFGARPMIPEGRRFERWLFGRRKYRGRERYVVGYEWSRMYSHHMSGRVHDAILGYGDDFDAALADAAKRVPAEAPK